MGRLPTGYVQYDLKPIAWDRVYKPRDPEPMAYVDESWPICEDDELTLVISGVASRYKVLAVDFPDEDDSERQVTVKLQAIEEEGGPDGTATEPVFGAAAAR